MGIWAVNETECQVALTGIVIPPDPLSAQVDTFEGSFHSLRMNEALRG